MGLQVTSYPIEVFDSSDVSLQSSAGSYAGLGFNLLELYQSFPAITRIVIKRNIDGAPDPTLPGAVLIDSGQQSDFFAAAAAIFSAIYADERALLDEIRTGLYAGLSIKLHKDRQFRDIHTHLHR